jgi:hypothetical protein
MDWKNACRLRLLADFDGSFFNERDEFIAHRYSNTYFIFSNCETELDVKCKVLEWLSRSAHKGIPYSQEWRNKKFRKFMLDGINMFLHTDFSFDDMEDIYTYLGNACSHKRTIDFIESGYDMKFFERLKEVQDE